MFYLKTKILKPDISDQEKLKILKITNMMKTMMKNLQN